MSAVQHVSPPRARHAARPGAEPLLASSLLSSSALDSIFDALSCERTPRPPDSLVLKTNTPSLDDALCSVFQRGSVVALSGQTASLRVAVATTLLVDCLIRDGESTVAVVDTTGDFDVVSLYKMIVGRLEREPGMVAEMRGCGRERGQAMQELAAKVLDRVKIMRVFDFVGLSEAVGELRDGLEGRTGADGAPEEMDRQVQFSSAEQVAEKASSPQPKKTEIADSEEEDEDEDEDEDMSASDEEMLFDAPAAAPAPARHSPPPPSPQSAQPLKLILIDNLAHVLTPLLQPSTLSTTSLATTLLTTLAHLTHTHALHTILLNPATCPLPPPSTATTTTITPGPQPSRKPPPPPPPSIFSSNAAVPALLALMSRYADAHVLVSLLPRGSLDAKAYHAGARVCRGERGGRGVQMVGVLEVVADRWGGRVGAWGAFQEGGVGMGGGDG